MPVGNGRVRRGPRFEVAYGSALSEARPCSSCRRLVDMGLRDILEEQAQAAAPAEGDSEEQNGAAAKAQKLTKKQKMDEAAAAGTRHITSFFAAAN